jgi:hypothetical protein
MIHFDLRGEPSTRLATDFSAACVMLKPSIAVGSNEARVGWVPAASTPQRKTPENTALSSTFRIAAVS